MKMPLRLIAVTLLASALFSSRLSAAPEKIKIKLAPMPGMGQLVPQLAVGLGYFEQEGLAVEMVSVMDWIDEDWVSAELLNNGTIDAEVNWYHRVVYGIGNHQPLKAVVLLEDSPGMKILVANQVKDQIKSAADFKGRRLSASAGFSTKRYLTEYVASSHGVGLKDVTFLPDDFQSHQPAAKIVKAIRNGEADVLTIMDPTLIGIEESGTMTTLYDLTNREDTKKALGDVWPARCLFVSPAFIKSHPETVQKLVNVFVRTMRFLNSHNADEICAKLPLSYYNPHTANDHFKEYRAEEKAKIRRALSTFTRGDYSVPPSAARFATKLTLSAEFDESGEGKYRKAARDGKVDPADTYDNRFVEKAMKEIR
jgi:NitT/TauT family transport system substrate-binding protein